MKPPLAFEIHQGWEGLKKLYTEWRALLTRIPDICFTNYPEWYEAYMQYLAPDPEGFYFVRALIGQHSVAIFPFERKHIRFGGISINVLSLPKHTDARMLDFILDPDYPEPIKLFTDMLTWLETRLPFTWDFIRLPAVLEEGNASHCVYSQNTFPLFKGARFTSKVIPIVGEEELVQRLSKNFRRNLRKAHNKLKREKDAMFESVSDAEGVQKAFEAFLKLEASGWKGKKGTAIACNGSLEGFYRHFLRAFSRTGHFELAFLNINAIMIAGLLIPKVHNTAYLYKIGYDESKRHLSPGILLIEWLLKKYRQEGKIKYVNSVTDAPFINPWKPASQILCNYYCFNHTIRGKSLKIILQVLFFLKKNLFRKRYLRYMPGT